MPFPIKERVKFLNNPLIEVVCQLTFMNPEVTNDIMSEEKITSLHKLLIGRFPLFSKGQNVNYDVNMEQQQVNKSEKILFEFTTLNQNVKVVISSGSIAVITNNYEGWEKFREDLDFVYNEINGLSPLGNIKRVGLRYKDVIQRSAIGLDTSTPWASLLNSKLLGVFSDAVLADQILSAQSNFSIELSGVTPPSRLNVNHGLVTNATTNEVCFMVDSDYFTDGDLKYAEAKQLLDTYNIQSRNFFQWCLTDELYRALQPERIN